MRRRKVSPMSWRALPEQQPSGPLLDVDDLRTAFRTPRGRLRAVDGVSASLDRGKTLGIVGESGSGKSVFVRSLMGHLPRYVERSGSVRFEGAELSDLNERGLRHYWGTEMAMVFQDPMTSLNPVKRIEPQITDSLRHNLGIGRADARERALALLESVGIPEPRRRLRDYPHQLSGGMRQRVTIAMALACGPKLLLADEPTTALDVTVQAQILNLLGQQQRERFMGMILVTHDLAVVAGRTDEVAVMYAGQIVEKAPTAVLFGNVRMPYTEGLLRSIPKISEPSHTRLRIIGGRPPDLVDPPAGCRFSPRCPYAQPLCHTDPPPLTPAETPGHVFRCWFPVGTDAGREALERNLARHDPAAEAAVAGDIHAAALVDAAADADAGGND